MTIENKYTLSRYLLRLKIIKYLGRVTWESETKWSGILFRTTAVFLYLLPKNIFCTLVGHVQNPPAIKIHPRSKFTRSKSTRSKSTQSKSTLSKSTQFKINPIKIHLVQNPPYQNQPYSKSTRVKIHPIKIYPTQNPPDQNQPEFFFLFEKKFDF